MTQKKNQKLRTTNTDKRAVLHQTLPHATFADRIIAYGGGTLVALFTVIAVFEIVMYGTWRLPLVDNLKGSALRTSDVVSSPARKNDEFILNTPASYEAASEEDISGDLLIESKEVRGSGIQGQKDVLLFDAIFSPKQSGVLRELVFHSDGYARPYDIASMQLYVNGKFASESAVFEGNAKFSSLSLRLEPGEQLFIEVKGKMSDEAVAGDRVQVGFKSDTDIVFYSDTGNRLSVASNFPVWGGYVSVIGKQL